MDPTDLLTWATAILALASLAGLGVQRTRVQTLTADLAAADRRVTIARADLTAAELDRARYEKRVAEKIAEQDTEIARLAADRDAYKRGMTGEEYWKALDEHLETHHTEAVAHWETMESKLDQQTGSLTDVVAALTTRGRRDDDEDKP